jgi:hypothetical protein
VPYWKWNSALALTEIAKTLCTRAIRLSRKSLSSCSTTFAVQLDWRNKFPTSSTYTKIHLWLSMLSQEYMSRAWSHKTMTLHRFSTPYIYLMLLLLLGVVT